MDSNERASHKSSIQTSSGTCEKYKIGFLGLTHGFPQFFFTDSLVLMFNNALYSKHNLHRTDHMKKVNHNAYDFRMAAIFGLRSCFSLLLTKIAIDNADFMTEMFGKRKRNLKKRRESLNDYE